jgi:membrane-associated phospholipid phosphatase
VLRRRGASRGKLRTSEWIQIGFAILLAAAAWIPIRGIRPLPARRRWTVTLLALIPLLPVALVRLGSRWIPEDYVSIARDWLTAGLFLVPYWQTGQFFLAPNKHVEERLMAFDRWLLPGTAATSGTPRTGFGMALEVAYLFCYPLVPLGLVALYVGHQRRNIAGFWLVVLIATYACYAITPFVPALPPRDLAKSKAAAVGKTRMFNRWILKHGSIHAISFPSAHVASTFAVSLVLLHFMPAVGLVFLFVSIWIAIGAVVGRYHYAIDVLLGAATALGVFAACYPYL